MVKAKTNMPFGCADEFTGGGALGFDLIEFFIEDLYYVQPYRAHKSKYIRLVG